MGDNQSLLQSLKDSPYFKEESWEKKLGDLSGYLQHLNDIQRRWVYLEPIFGRGGFPKEAARFRGVDDEFRAIMKDVARDKRVR